MNILIVADSIYGNTHKIAEAFKSAIQNHEIKLIEASNAKPSDIKDAHILIIGSPTHGGMPTEKTKQFIKSIPLGGLNGISAISFDTSIPYEDKNFIFKNFIKILGYAAKRTAKMLEEKGAEIFGYETFFVLEKEGPLKEGELERAGKWILEIIKKVKNN